MNLDVLKKRLAGSGTEPTEIAGEKGADGEDIEKGGSV